MDKKRILFVDDEADLVELVKIGLEAEGYEVITAYDGQEGFDKAKSENPDIILLDLMLPNINGYKVCRMLKFDDKYSHIPIIMLTAKAQEIDKELGYETGANAYITKPFEHEFLIEKIKELLG